MYHLYYKKRNDAFLDGWGKKGVSGQLVTLSEMQKSYGLSSNPRNLLPTQTSRENFSSLTCYVWYYKLCTTHAVPYVWKCLSPYPGAGFTSLNPCESVHKSGCLSSHVCAEANTIRILDVIGPKLMVKATVIGIVWVSVETLFFCFASLLMHSLGTKEREILVDPSHEKMLLHINSGKVWRAEGRRYRLMWLGSL